MHKFQIKRFDKQKKLPIFVPTNKMGISWMKSGTFHF